MSTGVVIAIVVAVLVVAAIVAALTLIRDNGGARLKHRFGPEYDRTLAQNDGDAKVTRQQLAERVKRFGHMERRPVDAQTAERYGTQWHAIQARFVDEPGPALAEADRLIGRLAAERGYPEPGTADHFDALSVHHPHEVQGYRQAHTLAEQTGAAGRRGTEDLRQALVSARTLFDEMLRDVPAKTAAAERTGGAEPARVPAGDPERGLTAEEAPAENAAAKDGIDGSGRSDRSSSSDSADGVGSVDGTDSADGAGADQDQSRRTPLSGRFTALTGTRKDR